MVLLASCHGFRGHRKGYRGQWVVCLAIAVGDGNLAAGLLLHCLAFFLRTIGFPCLIVEAVAEGSESMQNREGDDNEE